MLLTDNTRRCAQAHKGYGNHFRVWIDPIASRYAKADEATSIIGAHILSNEPGAKLDSVVTHDSKSTPSIQLCDLLLGGVMEAWQDNTQRQEKKEIGSWVASHLVGVTCTLTLGFTNASLISGTSWTGGSERRSVETRSNKLFYPLPSHSIARGSLSGRRGQVGTAEPRR
jgi:hypothetical protein